MACALACCTDATAPTGAAQAPPPSAAGPAVASADQAPASTAARAPSPAATATVPPPVHAVGRIPAEPSDAEKITCYLPAYGVDQLTLVGIATADDGSHRAMLEGPHDTPVSVSVGSLVGRDFGRIKEITETCVRGTRERRDYSGRKVIDPFQLCL